MITQNRTKGGYSLFNARHAEKIVWLDLHKQGTEQGPYSQHFICVVTYKWPNKLDCSITLALKGSPGSNTIAY